MDENGDKRDELGRFITGYEGGPGRPPDTFQTKIIKKATKELIDEYKEALGESLPLIKPVLIAKALDGDLASIKEINDRVMGKAEQKSQLDLTGNIVINTVQYGDK